jgi:hypothetical protein
MQKTTRSPDSSTLQPVPAVNLMDPGVEPSDAALRALMSSMERTFSAKNAGTHHQLLVDLKLATAAAMASAGIPTKH